ncbi:hypothetical protein CC78DRAFT_40394 [Lojkania enalia]|uniref:Uncharacterized protein n=1 Tax=Lojkania enalia TaxID=147567 RepID=A0A9P4N2S0_9PLEO|nr:hypothetical protein CC78DRAFT_40394 [Didymosphaeria enalia]
MATTRSQSAAAGASASASASRSSSLEKRKRRRARKPAPAPTPANEPVKWLDEPYVHENTPEALALMEKIERNRDAQRRLEHERPLARLAFEQEQEQEQAQVQAQEQGATEFRTMEEQSSTATPPPFKWTLRGIGSALFGWLSPNAPIVAPATAPPAVLEPAQAEELTETLAATPSRPPRQRPTPRTTNIKNKSKSTRKNMNKATRKRSMPDGRPLIDRVLKSVDQSNPKAVAWVEQTVSKIVEQGSAKLGEKRKRLEEGIKLSDLDEIPARKPWEASGYGFVEGFSDEEDEAEAPDWYVLDMIANDRPIKKRKADHTTDIDIEVPSLNDMAGHPFIDTHGNSASLRDMHPRPAYCPSPMFINPPIHQTDGNVFRERQQTQAPSQPAPYGPNFNLRGFQNVEEYEKEKRRTGHIPGSGSFCMPEWDSDSDEEETEDETESESTWLKQPPPPPTPAHATLPAPLTSPPLVPVVELEDPVKIQRALAMKHTPAKPSRLREAMIPSPSILSESADTTIVGDNTIIVNDDIPDILSMDLDSDIQSFVNNYVASTEYLNQTATAWGGEAVTLVYDDGEL